MDLNFYQSLDKTELKRRVSDVKTRLGKRLLILGHYYQQDEVIEFADREGDSFALAKAGAEDRDAEFIVFCGVHFMAESSAILARVGQRVFMPDVDAGCPLADMADIEQVEKAWKSLIQLSPSPLAGEGGGEGDNIIPITYINSSAELKAFCGKNGGIVCTSSNAAKAFDWALKQPPLPLRERVGVRGKKIFFFPDEHLGRNTANAKGFKRDEMFVWDPLIFHSTIAGEGGPEGAKIILWKGHCHVHTYFTVEHVKHARAKYPDCKVIVHPECTEEVVNLADANGSTSFIKKFAEEAQAGSTVVIGTEINFVNRLAMHNPDKKIVPLARSLCPNMFKTSLADLCYTLENLPNANEITVPAYIVDDAQKALKRMLELQ